MHYHRNKKFAEEIAEKISTSGGSAFALGGDITDEAQVQEIVSHAIRRLGTIGALVNCASGPFAYTKFADTQWSEMQRQLDMSVRANFLLAKAVMPVMKAAKYGRIIFLSTQAAEGAPPAELCGYVTGKTALIGLAKSMAVELAPHGICVNLVSPGMTDTDLIANVPEKVRLVTAAKAPMRRLAHPRDIAPVIAMLSSPAAGYISGETIRINGGQQML